MRNCEQQWGDMHGTTHCRNKKYACIHSGDFVGREVGWDNNNVDWANGVVSAWATSSFTGAFRGEPIQAVGRYNVQCTMVESAWLCTEWDTWHLNDGSLVKFAPSPWTFDDPLPMPYSGTLVDPPGRD